MAAISVSEIFWLGEVIATERSLPSALEV